MPEPTNGTIDRHTKIALGLLITIVGVLVTGGLAFTNWAVADATWKSDVKHELEAVPKLDARVSKLEERVVGKGPQGWHRGQMRDWVDLTEELNDGWHGANVDRIPSDQTGLPR